MDIKEDDDIKVSLPGAGETEPTISKIFARNKITNNKNCEIEDKHLKLQEINKYPNIDSGNLEKEDDVNQNEKILPISDDVISLDSNSLSRAEAIVSDTRLSETKHLEISDQINCSQSAIKLKTYNNKDKSDNVIIPQVQDQSNKIEVDIKKNFKSESKPSLIVFGNAKVSDRLTSIEGIICNPKTYQITAPKFSLRITEYKDSNINENETLIETTKSNVIQNTPTLEQSQEIDNIIAPLKISNSKVETQKDSGIQKHSPKFDLVKETIVEELKSGFALEKNNEKLNKNSISLNTLDYLIQTEIAGLSNKERQYCRFLRENIQRENDGRPPIPLQTYLWEDLRRSKRQGGYPWTYLYKLPLGPNEEPEIVQLQRRKEFLRTQSESPCGIKKVRILDKVSIKEAEKYINNITDNESLTEEDTRSVQSEPTYETLSKLKTKTRHSNNLRNILRRRNLKKIEKLNEFNIKDVDSNQNRNTKQASQKTKCCPPIMDKLKTLADKQLKKRTIKKIPLNTEHQIVLEDNQKILQLKSSPKTKRNKIAHFIEKQDSDDFLEIVELEDSPSKSRKHKKTINKNEIETTIVEPDEIIDIPYQDKCITNNHNGFKEQFIETDANHVANINSKNPPPKAPRKKRDHHIYEDIETSTSSIECNQVLEDDINDVLKKSLASQDQIVINEMEPCSVKMFKELGGSEESREEILEQLAPISSIDSTSLENEKLFTKLPALDEEYNQEKECFEVLRIVEENDIDLLQEPELKSALKREPSPLSDKKVTFQQISDNESDQQREDIELPEELQKSNRWSKVSDHEYEPIGQPALLQLPNESIESPNEVPIVQITDENDETATTNQFNLSIELEPKDSNLPNTLNDIHVQHENSAQDIDEKENKNFFLNIIQPQSDPLDSNKLENNLNDNVDIEDVPIKSESRTKAFITNAQNKSRKMQENLRLQANKISTKIQSMKKSPVNSPKSRERKKFRPPEFSRLKMPQIKRPDLSKLKGPDMSKLKNYEFKRPGFTKFTKPDVSKLRIAERFSSFRLKRTNSDKKVELSEEKFSADNITTTRKKFEFNFGTYPRILKKKKQRESIEITSKADDIPINEFPPSYESATIPRISRDKGPVGSKWTDKFSEVSYGDNESGKFQRYSSEPDSIGVMPQDISKDKEISITDQALKFNTLETVERKEFAEYDEENRAIHEISKIREPEFKQRRPIVHQDSDLVSEEGKEIGWSEKDIKRNKLLKRTETTESDTQQQDPEQYQLEEDQINLVTNKNQDKQSAGGFSEYRQKGVLEEIDDDEFFLRKRGISQDNIELRHYISTAIREGLSTPVNALAQLGGSDNYFPYEMDASTEQIGFGYDIPPPKPRRVKQYSFEPSTNSMEISQEFNINPHERYGDDISLPLQFTNGYQNKFPPVRPMRKMKQQYSEDSQDYQRMSNSDIPYFDSDDKDICSNNYMHDNLNNNLWNLSNCSELFKPPEAPKRQKKFKHQVTKPDELSNGYEERSRSNSFIENGNIGEEVFVYRMEHKYPIPLAPSETFTTPTPTPRQSRSRSHFSHFTDDDHTSHEVESIASEPQAIDFENNNGYAKIRKEPIIKPRAPVRRKRSTRSLGDQQFSSLPSQKKFAQPERPKRNYSTIGPTRPPRRKSFCDNIRIASSVVEYEELESALIKRPESPRNLHSGDVINKMKYRPLPPPPRPPRDSKKHKSDYMDEPDTENTTERISTNFCTKEDYDMEKITEKYIEVEVSTQTDPLPDDLSCEEFEITDDMHVIEPRINKTLEEFLLAEQIADIEQEKQIAEEQNLMRGLNRFRESNQRSFSERSRASTNDKLRTPYSRPTTPSAIIIERKIPSSLSNRESEDILEASLIVQPIEDFNIMESNELNSLPEKNSTYDSEYENEDKNVEKILNTSQISRENEKSNENNVEVPPSPPLRKRSSFTLEEYQNRQEKSIESNSVLPTPPVEDKDIFSTITTVQPNSLVVSDLEVQRLHVNALQADNILVSELHSISIKADELEYKTRNNTNFSNLEIPPNILENITQQIRDSEKHDFKPEKQGIEYIQAPARPPLPQLFSSTERLEYSVPTSNFSHYRNLNENDLQPSPIPHRRRRHYRRHDSTSDEELTKERRRSRQSTRSPELSIAQLSSQLFAACGSSLIQTIKQLSQYLHTDDKMDSKKNIKTAAIIFVLMIIAFLLISMSSDRNIHHHHWDYFNPPGNRGRD